MKKMRSGITTGACAAAAAKAATLMLGGQSVNEVEIAAPGALLTIPIVAVGMTNGGAYAEVRKDAGDDPDVTHGCIIRAEVMPLLYAAIEIDGGEGIGRVTKPGLAIAVGEAAINPVPRKMIGSAVREVLAHSPGARVVITVPGGEVLAKKTLNSVLGIEGGLSIIGTTGIVEPMSEERFKSSLTPQIDVVKALGHNAVVFVPGRIGEEIAKRHCGLPSDVVVQTSNFVGHMLEYAAQKAFDSVLIIGHPGKLVKLAAGIFHTHNRMADARMETLAAYAAAAGASVQNVRDIMNCVTTDAAMTIIDDIGLSHIYVQIAVRASERAERFVYGALKVGTVMATLDGRILGMDDNAGLIGGRLQWRL